MSLNLSVFKYPLGFVRVLELLFIIIALATVNSWHVSGSFKCPYKDAQNATLVNDKVVEFKTHTFTLSKAEIADCHNKTSALWRSDDNSKKSAGFFYFVNIVSLIFVLVVTFIYVILWEMYEANKRIALIDLAITALLFVFWFICASTWWSGSSNMGSATGRDHIVGLLNETEAFWDYLATGSVTETLEKSVTVDRNTAGLVISVLCGWVCTLLFAGNCWFVYKEVAPRKDAGPSSGIY